MDYVQINNTNIRISRMSFGCSNFGGIGSASNLIGKGDSETNSHDMLNIAYAFGINHFDTSTTYAGGESERILGKWLKRFMIPRDAAVISSKIGGRVPRLPWRRGLSKKHITRELESSLKRLQVDYLDLLYTHMPDPNTPVEETLTSLNAAVKQGKVKKLGASNVDLIYLKHSLEISRANSLAEYEVVQNNYNFLHRKDEADLIPFCHDNQILYIAYGPLDGGILTGKYKKGCKYPNNSRLYFRPDLYKSTLTDSLFSCIETLHSYAQNINISLPTLMYAWLYKKSPIDSFLIGARNELQFAAAADSLHVHISDDAWQELDRIASYIFSPQFPN